jgi:hypothetical protein
VKHPILFCWLRYFSTRSTRSHHVKMFEQIFGSCIFLRWDNVLYLSLLLFDRRWLKWTRGPSLHAAFRFIPELKVNNCNQSVRLIIEYVICSNVNNLARARLQLIARREVISSPHWRSQNKSSFIRKIKWSRLVLNTNGDQKWSKIKYEQNEAIIGSG